MKEQVATLLAGVLLAVTLFGVALAGPLEVYELRGPSAGALDWGPAVKARPQNKQGSQASARYANLIM